MQPTFPHIEVEPLFDEVVREYGGGVVLKDKVGTTLPFPNADYIFHFEKVVAELKCLTEDNTDSPNVQAKLNAVIQQYHSEGKITTTEVNDQTWKTFPQHLQNDVYTIVAKSIQARVKKANQQIRETKLQYGLNDYTGLLLIVNDGLINLPPAAFIQAVQRYASNNCHSINHFIYFTVNLFTLLEELAMPSLFWLPFNLQNGPPIDEPFTYRLQSLWQGRICRKTGMRGFSKKLQDMEQFWHAKHM